jgi:hypothetical protein
LDSDASKSGPAAGAFAPAGFPDEVAELESTPARRRRPALWGATIALAVVVVTALLVGNGGTTWTSNRVVLSQAATRTSGSGTARISGSGSFTLNGRTTKLLDVQGTENFGDKSAMLTVKVGPLTEHLRTVRGTSYLSVPGVDLPRGARWVSFGAADLKLDAAARASLGSQDPSSGLRYLSAVNGNPRVVDHNPLDGVDVTHYAFALDLKTLFRSMGNAARSANASGFGASIEQLGSLVDLSAVPGEAWIDTGGRVREFTLRFDFSSAGQHVTASDEFRFSHFGEPVHVSAPAPSDTIPFRDDPTFFADLGKAALGAGSSTPSIG